MNDIGLNPAERSSRSQNATEVKAAHPTPFGNEDGVVIGVGGEFFRGTNGALQARNYMHLAIR
jgi:hypothetical protein